MNRITRGIAIGTAWGIVALATSGGAAEPVAPHPSSIQDISQSDMVKQITQDFSARDLTQPRSFAAGQYQFSDHGTFFEVNALDSSLFTSSNFDNKLYSEVIDAINDWYSTGLNRDPDFVVFYKAWDPAGYFAFYAPLSNDTRGIGYQHGSGQEVFDQTPGSALQGLVWMSSLNQYNYAGQSRTILNAFWGQEIGHRWGSFMYFDNEGFASNALLGRDLAHWSYFMDSDWSVMEGNDWIDNGDGTFSTNNLGFGTEPAYNLLDLYDMGLVPGSAVDDMFVILGPQGTSRSAASAPEEPFGGSVQTVTGTRLDVTMEDIQAIEGFRSPDWTTAPRGFKVAMFVLSREGGPMNSTQIQQATNYADWMMQDFAYNTHYLASLDLTTGPPKTTQPPTGVISANTEAKTGKAVTFDASASTDPEGTELAFVWDFGDDTAEVGAAQVSHVYESKGTYTVTLVTVDRDGGKAVTTHEIQVKKSGGDDGGLLSGCECAVTSAPSRKVPGLGLLFGLIGALALVAHRRRHS